jgi:hypothetical protein
MSTELDQLKVLNAAFDKLFGPVTELPKPTPVISNERRTFIDDVQICIGRKHIYVSLEAHYTDDGNDPHVTNIRMNGDDIGVPECMQEFVQDWIREECI